MGSDTKIDKLGARRFDDGGWWWYSSRRGHRNEDSFQKSSPCLHDVDKFLRIRRHMKKFVHGVVADGVFPRQRHC